MLGYPRLAFSIPSLKRGWPLLSEVGAVCRNSACTDLCGGPLARVVPTATGDVLSSTSNHNVLMVDLDAQMSLTQAIALNENTGRLFDQFDSRRSPWHTKRRSLMRSMFTKPNQPLILEWALVAWPLA